MVRRVALKNQFIEARIFKNRVAVAAFLVVVSLGFLSWQYFSLQVISYEKYRTESDRNRVQLLPVAPKRGLIFDRNGELLAANRSTSTLMLVPERIDDLNKTIERLQQLIDIDQEKLDDFEKRRRRYRPYQSVPVKFGLTEKEIAVIGVNQHLLSGVEVEAELVRYYPHGDLFAHAIGYVGRINEKELATIDASDYSATHSIGKIGIEKYYEHMLHGIVGYQNVETNARGRVLRVLESHPPVAGNNITLNLDIYLQEVAKEALGSERGAVVAIDPNDGSVLAMMSTPSFDANWFVNGISRKQYQSLNESLDLPLFNRALQGQYPPGSTVKPIYGLAGLHYGVITAGSTVADPGWYQLPNDDRLYRDWKRQGHGKQVNLDQAIVESCDTFFYDLAYQLGIDRISEFAGYFGLGASTGADNTNERQGLLPSRQWKRATRREPWFPGETLNVGIGQGYMLVTPLQLASMTATIAMRGTMVVPRFVAEINQAVHPVKRTSLPAIIEGYWDYIINSMVRVVHYRKGTASKIAKGVTYQMAGKTGTAQVVGIAQGEKYDAEKLAKLKHDHALFVGFAPVDRPQIAVAVVVENGGSGSAAAAPIARKLFDAYLLPRTSEQEVAISANSLIGGQ